MVRLELVILASCLVAAYGTNEGQQNGRILANLQQEENDLDLTERGNPQRCGTGNSCVDGQAQCRGGTCVCAPRYAWGDGTFACYPPNTLGAEIKNDPQVITFQKESYKFPYLCRYMITHVKQNLKDSQGADIGTCEFKVFGFNARKRGKIFIFGFDVATKITYADKNVRLSTRNYGVLKNKMPYIYSMGTMNKFRPNGPWNKAKIEYEDADMGIMAKLYGVESNQQVVYKVDSCGFKITFVPYDVIKRRKQIRVPGVALSINKDHAPEYLTRGKSMALPPEWGQKSYLRGHKVGGVDHAKSMLYRAFRTGIEQNQPYGAGAQCDAISTAFDSCTGVNRKRAINRCYWILDEPRFMRCYDRGFRSRRLLKLYRDCVRVFCGETTCQSVIDDITESGCDEVPDIRPLNRFVRGAMCPT